MTHDQHVPPMTVKKAGYVFASPELKGRTHPSNGSIYTARGLFNYNIKQVLYRRNKWHAKRKKLVSEDTRRHRFIECVSMGHDLHNLGYRLMLPTQIREKHLIALTRYWEKAGLKPSSILQKVSILRTFLYWIEREALLVNLTPEKLYANPEEFKRSLVASVDKSWEGKVDILQLISDIEEDDRFVARQLKLQHFFGMRAKESMMFRPCIDYDNAEGVIRLTRGTKGGRPRELKVDTKEQRQLLEELQNASPDRNSSMIPHRKELGAWIKHYYRVCNRHGISRQNGITSHGLRHGYAHNSYEKHSGQPAAVKTGNRPDQDIVNDRIARLLVSEELGHSRMSISSAYIG